MNQIRETGRGYPYDPETAASVASHRDLIT